MSIEKCKLEAERWLITAKDDLDTATILRKNNKSTIYSGLHSYNICNINPAIKYPTFVIPAKAGIQRDYWMLGIAYLIAGLI